MPIRPDMRARYPSHWRRLSRYIRYYRAGNRCEECGARNGLPHPETGAVVVLSTGHVNHVPEDCRESNLKAWCQRCHNRHDAGHRQRGRRERERLREGMLPFAFDHYGLCPRCGLIRDRDRPCPLCSS